MLFTESLRKNQDFRNVYAVKKSYVNKYYIMYVSENHLNQNRIGISVSKKVGNSVVRHRIKRLVKEAYRLSESMFISGIDIVVVSRASSAEIGYKETLSAILHLAGLHHILKAEKESF